MRCAREFIGHPLVGKRTATLTRELFCKKYGLEQGGTIISILPGSRPVKSPTTVPVPGASSRGNPQEAPSAASNSRCVAARTGRPAPGVRFPAEWQVRFLRRKLTTPSPPRTWPSSPAARPLSKPPLLGKPMIVVYRLSPLTAKLARPLVRTKFFGMVNLIAGRGSRPELIQHNFTPQRVARRSKNCCSPARKREKNRVKKMARGLEEVRRLLGQRARVERAADEIARLLTIAPKQRKLMGGILY